jgi:dienelactone hydrolase
MRAITTMGLSALLAFCAAAVSETSAAGDLFNEHQVVEQPIQVPIDDPQGHRWVMQGHICRPDGINNPRLVVINHGSPARASDRPGMAFVSCNTEAAQWFLQRHYAVVFVLRLGYGATGGPWAEGYGGCEEADYYRGGLETAREINAIVDYAVTLPGVEPNGVIVVGHSAGGWGTIAYDSIAHPRVAAFINMAGGRGGHYHDQPDSNCHPEKLAEAVAQYGKTSSTPMLWVYAKNDSFFNPKLASVMHQYFVHAGGRAELYAPEGFDGDGHRLFFGQHGSDDWGPLVEKYLNQQLPASGSR